MVNVKIKKLNEKAVVPTTGTAFSAGLDLVATSCKPVPEGAYIQYGTSLAVEIPEGYMGLIFPRSSISSNTTLTLCNSVGLIDSDYRNEILVRFRNLVPGSPKVYKVGEKVAQLVIIPYPKIQLDVVETLNDPNTRFGGFGSTDNETIKK